MRWLIIGLGAITFLLAVVIARERLWWIAVPDGLFGLGVAWVAWADIHSAHRPARPETSGETPAVAPVEVREVRAAPAAAPVLPPPPQPAAAAQPLPPPPTSAGHPRRVAKRRARRHRH
ncbi:MAG: hypothetical protein ACRD2H_00990 [Terriglobales bacterium]